MPECRAKFYVSKVAEMGYASSNGAQRNVAQKLKKFVPANAEDPDDHSVTRYNRSVYENTDVPAREITLNAISASDNEENRHFSAATPSGMIQMYISNAALADEFKIGDVYYVDFTKTKL